jgi:Uma2 family endonuclease
MVSQARSFDPATIVYPESDGQPMADNTEQFRWIVVIKENLEWLFADNPDVFIAGDLLWYPIEGKPQIRIAPDALVAFGRPKGKRGSYLQWKEENVAPQIVFEVLSPGNTKAEMNRKLLFYDRYGVEEYYQYDPNTHALNGWLRRDDFLDVIEPIADWVSPRLKIRFDLSGEELQIFHLDGERFLTYTELGEQRDQAEQRADQAEQRAERLSELGIDPDQV